MEMFNRLEELFEEYRRKHMRMSAESTVKQYRVTLRNLGRFLGHPPRISDLTDDTLQDAMAWFLGLGRTERGVNKLRSNVLTLWKFANRKGWIRTLPDVAPLVVPENPPRAWMQDELDRLFRQFKKLPGSVAGIPAWQFWTGLHLVMFDTAERIGALLQVPWANVSLSGKTMFCDAKTRKGKRAGIVHALHADTANLLRQIERPRKLVFEWPYSPSYLWISLRKIIRDAGLPDDRSHRFHCMRRTTASMIEKAGGNATKLLGHSSRAVTLKHYLDPRITGTDGMAPCDILRRPAG